MNPKLKQFFSIIGLAYISLKTYHLIKNIYKNFLRNQLPLLSRYSQINQQPYALITGGASGIGLGIAQEFASLGFNLLIIDRNCKNLPNFPTNIDVQSFELNIGGSDGWKQIVDLTKQYDIAVLINNVGMTPIEEICEFANMNQEAMQYLLYLNMFPCVFLCHHYIPLMQNRQAKSCIINISSGAAMIPQPFLSTYSATKAFIDFFTQAISWECKDKIDVVFLQHFQQFQIMVVKPGPVQTALNPIKIGIIGITPQECAKAILRDIGYESTTYGAKQRNVFKLNIRIHKFVSSLFEGSSVQFIGNSMKQHLNSSSNLQRREQRLKQWEEIKVEMIKNK